MGVITEEQVMRNPALAFTLLAHYTWDKANSVLMMFRLLASWIRFS
jgi:hypothetical protein